MPKIKALRDTFLKSSIASSADLPANGKIEVKAGTEIDVNWVLPDRNQHDRIELTSARNGRFNWFVYAPHFQEVGGIVALLAGKPQTKAIVPGTPYFAQCDSRWDGYRYCFSHSVAMAISTLIPNFRDRAKNNGFDQPENYYISKLDGDTTDNTAQIRCMKEFGIDAYFTTTASPADLQSAIRLNVPVPIGVAYKASGHWILLKGFDKGSYIINDPYGVRSGAASFYAQTSSDRGREGENDTYSAAVMDQIFWDARTDHDRDCGWAILITAVNGKPTGVKSNL